MTPKIKTALEFAKQQKIEMVDLKFCDLFVLWHHLTVPTSQFDKTVFTREVAFDGSIVPDFKKLEAGSGMHFHVQLWKNGKNLFYDENEYVGLSQTAAHFIGGILKHGPALLAFTNHSTISYKRLIPGFEALVKAIFGLANRSAAIRIPKYTNTTKTKRFEFRPPDATCNIYLAISALLMAGTDGVNKKIDPTKEGFGPYDINIFKIPKTEQERLKSLPSSLKEALGALVTDHDFLLMENIFSKQLIESWIDHKLNKEFNEVRSRPHPYEMRLYYDV